LAISLVLGAAVLPVFSTQDARAVDQAASRTPVLVELFTSEGCSDCPPADALLQKIDREQPVSGAEVIVMSEHVDYWDGAGWRDPYSSHEYSERQSAYAEHLRLGGIYTPQMIVDGRFGFIGSNEKRAIQAIQSARQGERAQVSLSSIRWTDSSMIALHVTTGTLPVSVSGPADVFLATADESDQSSVSRGENSGRTLTHVAVLRTLTRVGTADRSSGFSGDAKIWIRPGNSQNLRIVAIVQEAKAGRVWGVASGRISR
jgi:hypothetical protein